MRPQADIAHILTQRVVDGKKLMAATDTSRDLSIEEIVSVARALADDTRLLVQRAEELLRRLEAMKETKK